MSVPGLEVILQEVREHAALRKSAVSSRADPPASPRRPFRQSLERNGFSVIAEIKRASPSAGPIRPDLTPAELAREYQASGANAISVLTCAPYFCGRPEDLGEVKSACDLPVLCKDFILDEFQIEEAAAFGADAILLIAAALSDDALHRLGSFAGALGLEILFEAHDAEELDRLRALKPELLGINSRNLKTMNVDLAAALALADNIPGSALGVLESGLKTAADAKQAWSAGFRAALIGESLLKAPRPGAKLKAILGGVRTW